MVVYAEEESLRTPLDTNPSSINLHPSAAVSVTLFTNFFILPICHCCDKVALYGWLRNLFAQGRVTIFRYSFYTLHLSSFEI